MNKYTSLLLITISTVFISCKETKDPTETVSDSSKSINQDHGYNELANEGNKELFTTSDYNTDNSSIPNIKRPEKSDIKDFRFDRDNLFGIWTINPDDPHATFQLDEESFYVVDYDGDGAMPYLINEDSITVFYNDFIKHGIVNASNKDTLKIFWEDTEMATPYSRWKN